MISVETPERERVCRCEYLCMRDREMERERKQGEAQMSEVFLQIVSRVMEGSLGGPGEVTNLPRGERSALVRYLRWQRTPPGRNLPCCTVYITGDSNARQQLRWRTIATVPIDDGNYTDGRQ